MQFKLSKDSKVTTTIPSSVSQIYKELTVHYQQSSIDAYKNSESNKHYNKYCTLISCTKDLLGNQICYISEVSLGQI